MSAVVRSKRYVDARPAQDLGRRAPVRPARAAQRLAGRGSRDSDLPEAATAPEVAGRLVDLRDGDPQRADASRSDVHPGDPGPEPRANAADLDLALDPAPVAEGQQVDVRDVAGTVEPHLEPALEGRA
jgi:hypothetical protein